MELSDGVATETLNTLRYNIAVLDEDGVIIATNDAWVAFGRENDIRTDPDTVGANYLAATEQSDDGYARAAARGIGWILRGSREAFSLEYPCHSPEVRRWFRMDATAIEHGGERYCVVVHHDITPTKEAEIQARRERRDLQRLVDQISGIIQDVTTEVLYAESRAEMERALCDRLVAEPRFQWAAVADTALTTLEFTIGYATEGAPFDESDRIEIGDRSAAAVRGPIDDGAVVVIESMEREGLTSSTKPDSGGAYCLVPVRSNTSTYAVVVIGLPGTDALGRRDRPVLAALGRIVGTAIAALERHQLLVADNVVQLDFQVSGADRPLCHVANALEAGVSLVGSALGGTDTAVMIRTPADPEEVAEAVADQYSISDSSIITAEDSETLFEIEPVTETIAEIAADCGGRVTAADRDAAGIRVSIDLAPFVEVRSFVYRFQNRVPGAELVTVRNRDRPPGTAPEFRSGVTEALTDRQFEALRRAFYGGFYDDNRSTTGDELAKSMDVTRATFHQHRRAAERKLLAAFFDGDGQPD